MRVDSASAAVRVFKGIRALEDGWDNNGAPAPSLAASSTAETVWIRGREGRALPSYIVPVTSGGVAVVWGSVERMERGCCARLATVDVDNAGVIRMTLDDRETNTIRQVDVSVYFVAEAIKQIRAFVLGH